MNVRQPYLRLRQALNLPPLPEEMLGVRGPDPYDGRDRMKSPKDGPVGDIGGPFLSAKLRTRSQGRSNKCGGYTGQAAIEIRHQRAGFDPVRYSANEVYWHARPNKEKDSGVHMRDLMRALKRWGSVREDYWLSHSNMFRRPESVSDAPALNIESYERVKSNVEDWIQVLGAENLPILIGFKVFRRAAAEARRTGVWPIPDDDDILDGYHAVPVGVFRPSKRYGVEFDIWNSWGPSRFKHGCQRIPKQYVTERLVVDAWSEGIETFAGIEDGTR